jgi:hypothetical protein
MISSIFYDVVNPTSGLDWIQSGGIIGLLLFIIVGGSRKWWVFGWQYKDLQDRYEKVEQSNLMWMQISLRGVNITEKIVSGVKDESTENV